MKRPQAHSHPALLVEVLTDIGRGNVWEKFIHDDQIFVHGETVGRQVTVNPAIAIVDTLVHECLHRLRPNWSERYVRRTTTFLLRRMSDEQIQKTYEVYQQRAKRKR